MVGIFALTEVFTRLGEKPVEIPRVNQGGGFKFPPLNAWLLRKKTLIKSSIIGTFIGVLPGTGAATASFIAYSEARRAGVFRENLGNGANGLGYRHLNAGDSGQSSVAALAARGAVPSSCQ